MGKRKSMFQASLSSIIAGIIVAMVVYFGLNFAGFKEYRANARLISTSVENNQDANNAESYAATLNSKAIKERTLENLKIDWSISKLDSRLKISASQGSNLIDITVTDTNKLRAEDLADEFSDLAVTVINNIYNTGASVEKYAYQDSRPIDNTIKYAGYAGGVGFILYLLMSIVNVKRHNAKLDKQLAKAGNKESAYELKTLDQIKKEEKLESLDEEKSEEDLPKVTESTRPQESVKASDLKENFDKTRKIDAAEIKRAEEKKTEKSDSKLEVLGKLPSYKIGALDV